MRFSNFKQETGGNEGYKTMNNFYYYTSTLILFVSEAILAVIIEDVTTVFDFVAAIAVSFIAFGFPAAFYLSAEKRYASEEQLKKPNCTRVLARVNVFLCVFAIIVCMSSNVITIIRE